MRLLLLLLHRCIVASKSLAYIWRAVMQTGIINILAFIGTHKAAQQLHQAHPKPFTVRLALGLDAKNCAIVTSKANLDVAVAECVLGALSFNGQRCTATKLIYVHESVADAFVQRMAQKIDALKVGLPWQPGVQITPVAEPGKDKYLSELVSDALGKGAKVVNQSGNKVDGSFFTPTLLYPCDRSMRVATEEQFGPLVPVIRYQDVKEVQDFFISTDYGQQAALFTDDSAEVPAIIDFLAHHVTRININAQCQRGPGKQARLRDAFFALNQARTPQDCMPFGGRKVSAAVSALYGVGCLTRATPQQTGHAEPVRCAAHHVHPRGR